MDEILFSFIFKYFVCKEKENNRDLFLYVRNI